MRKLVAVEFVTLDGVMEGPGDDPHRDGKNKWALRIASDDQQRYNSEQMFEAGAVLLGRVTYQLWAAFWPSAPKDEGFADRINILPKYVVSKTLRTLEWNNSRLMNGDVPAKISKLKEEPGGDIFLSGSADLLNSLMPHKLIDEFRLMIFPVVLGSGKRLFRDESDTTHLRLVSTRTFESGVVVCIYQPATEAPSSKYTETFAWTKEVMQSLEAAQNSDRVLATILFTDIVDSTRRASELGDRSWRQLLDRHDRICRAEVERFNGKLIKTTGDGILAMFDAPTRALRCAFGLGASLAQAGLPIRAAIHTGEIEVRDNDVGGIGVHIASRALAQAGDRQVMVTRTVRDLATGTDLHFAPLGSVSLQGVPGEWELFAASTG